MAKKLEEIKEEECPYELPEGWKWERLGNVADWSSGGTPSRKHQEYYDGGKINWLKTGDLNDGYIYSTEERITEAGIKNSSAKIFPIDTVIIAMYGATIGKCGILQIESATNQACACAICNAHIFNKYLYYYLMNSKYRFIELGKGGAQPNISQTIIINFLLPLPPKETQQKIVDIIESLFAKLDIAQEKVEHVLAESENRRSAILHNAFSGKLTEKWREENNVSFDSWNEYKIKDIAKNIKDKYDPEKDKFLNIPYIGLEHIEKNNGIVGFSSSEGVKSIKTLFNKNDVLYGKLRPYLDKHDIAEYNGMCSTDIIVYRCKLKETAIILNYVMSTKQFIEYAVTNSKGINLPRTSEKIISEYKLQLPLLTEQKEIVRLLDKFLSVEDKVKSTCQSTLEAIATMRKSILAKAFRGELVS